MLQEFLRRGKKGATNLVPISGRVPLLNLEFDHGRSGVQRTVENLPRDRHGSDGFWGGFFRSQNAKEKSGKKKSAGKSASRKQNPPAHDPPPPEKAASQAQKSAAKRTNKSTCQTSKYTPGFFRLRRIALESGKKKPININILGGTVSGTNRNRPWDKRDPLPGTNWDPSLGQTGLFLFNSTVKSPFCPVCPWDGWGFVPGTIVPQGSSEKCLCVFRLLVFFAPN